MWQSQYEWRVHQSQVAEGKGSETGADVTSDSKEPMLTALQASSWGPPQTPDLSVIPVPMPCLFDHTCFYVPWEWVRLALLWLSLLAFIPFVILGFWVWSLFGTKSNGYMPWSLTQNPMGTCLPWFSVPCLPCRNLPRPCSAISGMFRDNLLTFCLWFILEDPMSNKHLAPCSPF